MTISDRARRSIVDDLKRVTAKRRKKEQELKRIERDIQKLRDDEADLNKALEG